MSWARRHLVALVLLPLLLLASAWLVGGSSLTEWVRAEAILAPVGQQGVQQTLPTGTLTVQTTRVLPPDAQEAADLELPADARIVLVDVDIAVDEESTCIVSLEGSWRGEQGSWQPDWSLGDLSYCTSGEAVSGSMGFVVPDGVTDLRLVMVAGEDAVEVALEP